MRYSQGARRLVARIAIVASGAVGVAGCEEGTGPSREIRVAAVTPTDLVGRVGQQVTPVPTVAVTDAEGNPLAGELVYFSAGTVGTVDGRVVETDADGIAAPRSWTLGSSLGTQSLAARVDGTYVLFTATAEVGPPGEIWVLAGHGQLGEVNTALPEPIEVWVEDGYLHSVAGAPVTFSVISGGGTLTASASVTDSAGRVAATWTLGPSEGLQEASARSGSVEIIFSAIASCGSGGAACGGSLAAVCPSTDACGTIAFVSARDGNPEIYSIRADGTDLRRLTFDPADDVSPAWSPDGRRIAFASQRGGDYAIYVMNADGSGVVQLTPRVRLSSTPSWSPDGASVVYTAFDSGSMDLWVVSPDPGGPGPAPFVSLPGWDGNPVWSPDGMRLAFVSDWNAYDFVFDIYVVDADGEGRVPLTGDRLDHVDYHGPAWSPSGTKLAVTVMSEIGADRYDTRLGVMNLDGSGLTLLRPAGDWSKSAWSPDGGLLAYTFGDVGRPPDIRWVSADGTSDGLIVADGSEPSWRS